MKPVLRLLSIGLAIAGFAKAELVTAQGGGVLEDLSTRQGMGYGLTNGPVTLGSGIVFTAGGSAGAGAILGTGTYYLGTNGTWGEAGDLYMGTNNMWNAWIRLELPSLATEVTAFMNYAPVLGGAPTIVALDALGRELESYNLAVAAPILLPGGFHQGAFRGISRAAGDIKYFEIRNSYIVASDIRFVAVPPPPPPPPPPTPLDENPQPPPSGPAAGEPLSSAALPEPAACLLGAAAISMACLRRRIA